MLDNTPLVPLAFLMLVAGLVWARPWRGRGSALLLLSGLLALFLGCWPPVAWLACWSLERDFPARQTPPGDAQAIVVLAGGIYSGSPAPPEPVLGIDTYRRCQYAAWLYRNWKPLPVVVSGGPAEIAPGWRVIAANWMQRALVAAGVPAAALWTETSSTSTFENAVRTARLLAEKHVRRIVLVTEAFHMGRAAACFRKQGLEVVPAACGHRAALFQARDPHYYLPSARSAILVQICLREWLSRLWYKARSYT